MKTHHLPLVLRTLLAVTLTLGFYALGLTLVGALLALPYLEWQFLGRVDAVVVLLSVIGSLSLLWTIIPRPTRFVPPGPRITPEEQPRLFAMLRQLANATGQPMPDEVYLLAHPNAWVQHHGGFLGFRGTWVMGVGLPLFQICSLAQLQAIIAHEFGHYQGRDLSPALWIYQTRDALERAQNRFRRYPVLCQLFDAYARLFFRLTHTTWRHQEFAADAVAAHVVGTGPLISILQTITGISKAYEAFLSHEYQPALESGGRPPLLEGFSRFLHAEEIARITAELNHYHANEATASLYDTHPSIAERLAALHTVEPTASQIEELPSEHLLDNIPALELHLLTFVLGLEAAAALRPVSWDELGQQILLPLWAQQTERYTDILAGVTFATLPTFLRNPLPLITRLRREADAPSTQEELESGIGWIVGAAIAVALHREGWLLYTEPGMPVTFVQAETPVLPFALPKLLADHQFPVEAWEAHCRQLGIEALPLALPGEPQPESPLDAAPPPQPVISAAGIPPRRAVLVGHLAVTLPALMLLVTTLFGTVHLDGPLHSIDFLITGLATTWLWWAWAIPYWRRWAVAQGAAPDALEALATQTGLLWPKAALLARFKFRSDG